jgi:hypothetical protein
VPRAISSSRSAVRSESALRIAVVQSAASRALGSGQVVEPGELAGIGEEPPDEDPPARAEDPAQLDGGEIEPGEVVEDGREPESVHGGGFHGQVRRRAVEKPDTAAWSRGRPGPHRGRRLDGEDVLGAEIDPQGEEQTGAGADVDDPAEGLLRQSLAQRGAPALHRAGREGATLVVASRGALVVDEAPTLPAELAGAPGSGGGPRRRHHMLRTTRNSAFPLIIRS